MASNHVMIGVATTVQPRRISVHGNEVFRPALHFCRMAQYARTQNVSMVLFNPSSVDWAHNRVSGWHPKDAGEPFGSWVKIDTRLPDAIYENVFVHLAVAGYSSKLRAMANQRGIPLFNPPLPSKWQMTLWMKKAGLTQYLPDTLYLKDVGQALGAIDRWGVAYVKPVGGYGGMGVVRVEAQGQKRYRISVDRQKSGGRLRVVVSRAELAKWLLRRKGTPHIVQQGIRLLTVDGRKVDFRVVVQRGADGAWNLVGIIPKIAAADGVVTNIIAGGERQSLSQLEALASREGVRIPTADLGACALAIANKLSTRSPRAGILGFDLGVDTSGHVLVIEMNPKPARSLLSDDMKKVVAKHAVGFAAYLAKRSGR